MLSINRDLWVKIPGGQREGKINTAHFLGEVEHVPGGGPALAMQTVQAALDIPVQYYIRLNFSAFEQLIDLCGMDYSDYGDGAWDGSRFAVVVHLLSVSNNQRVRVRVFCPDDELPAVASVVDIWPAANWFEREAFDLYGIVFEGHPDLRRILTDYGFIGHPFRKDFPLTGNVEVRYDPARARVVYEPVEIEPRTLVPRVDFISAAGKSEPNVYRTGGPIALVTNRCLFSFADGRFTLESVHPGHTVEEVIENTGFDFERPATVPETPAPSAETLRLMRTVVAPQLAEVYPQFAAQVFGDGGGAGAAMDEGFSQEAPSSGMRSAPRGRQAPAQPAASMNEGITDDDVPF